MVGRGTRLYPGKGDLLILDLVGATGRHDLMTASKLFDIPEHRAERGESVAEAHAAMKAEAERATDGRRVATDVDPFGRGRLVWTPTASGAHALSVGEHGTLFLVPKGDTWDVVRAARDRTVSRVASGLTLGYAQGVAEDVARGFKAEVLSRRDAPWRRGPASVKQQETLTRWRRWRPGMTKGEASDAITAYIAGRVSRGLTAA
jgi:hypothetical protein